MKLYRFLTGPDNASFCHRITDALNKGWELHGAPQYSYDQNKQAMLCGQAVTKAVEGKEYTPDMKLSDQ